MFMLFFTIQSKAYSDQWLPNFKKQLKNSQRVKKTFLFIEKADI